MDSLSVAPHREPAATRYSGSSPRRSTFAATVFRGDDHGGVRSAGHIRTSFFVLKVTPAEVAAPPGILTYEDTPLLLPQGYVPT